MYIYSVVMTTHPQRNIFFALSTLEGALIGGKKAFYMIAKPLVGPVAEFTRKGIPNMKKGLAESCLSHP